MDVLEVKGLKKSLGGKLILDDISFTAQAGEVLGFLGPNGSGKTTTIRCITGLIYPNSGTIQIGGHNIQKDGMKARSLLGCVVENPEPYLYMSGLENLRQVARIRKLPSSEIDRVIRKVGLDGRIRDKVKKYSLGMKQRLGVATALLGNPKLLILDEPTNGLDPDGMREFREMIRSIADDGTTVFLSSHLLAEVQQICDRVVFIEAGRVVSTETMSAVRESHTYFVELKPLEEYGSVLSNIPGVTIHRVHEGGYEIMLDEMSRVDFIRTVVQKGLPLEGFHFVEKNLEERYVELMKGGIR
ncbi:ABC transporter ATP-binding protein [Guggenheimella bovis]